jgi:hypothetical protein
MARMPPTINVMIALGGLGIDVSSVGLSDVSSVASRCKQIFLLVNTRSVTLLLARLSVTSIEIVTSTSAALTPEHRMSMAKVSISCDISPTREMFNCGLGSTTGSDVAMLIR